jgi:5-oxoprolinase (ATP-hydrolysing) subunit A
MLRVDLNCDMGEGFPFDALLMQYISSANIACGGHAGNSDTMRQTIQMAAANQVAAGAHPSFPDKKNFGRENMELTALDVYREVLGQVSALSQIAASCDYFLAHVKPHGALYNRAAKDRVISGAIVKAIYDSDPRLLLYGLSGSFLLEEARALGLGVCSEVFADRTYQQDGHLTPRSQAGALIQDPAKSVDQVLQMVQKGSVTTLDGQEILIQADTVCLHGDQESAPAFAKLIREALITKGIRISPPARLPH